eukprot:6175396-Pleurochrysis_carterae.AAC.1
MQTASSSETRNVGKDGHCSDNVENGNFGMGLESTQGSESRGRQGRIERFKMRWERLVAGVAGLVEGGAYGGGGGGAGSVKQHMMTRRVCRRFDEADRVSRLVPLCGGSFRQKARRRVVSRT